MVSTLIDAVCLICLIHKHWLIKKHQTSWEEDKTDTERTQEKLEVMQKAVNHSAKTQNKVKLRLKPKKKTSLLTVSSPVRTNCSDQLLFVSVSIVNRLQPVAFL